MDHRRWCSGTALHLALILAAVFAEESFNTSPPPFRSNFACYGRTPGFYADVDANCKVYHTCDDYGNKFTYRCPEETAFRQDALICDHAHLVDCRAITYANREEATINPEAQANPSLPGHQNPNGSSNPRAFSRSFQVIQQPKKSLTNKAEPGFVFSASVFLRDLDDNARKLEPPEDDNLRDTRRKAEDQRIQNDDGRNDSPTSSTIRPLFRQFQPKPEPTEQFANIRTEKSSFSSQDRQTAGRNIDFHSGKHNQVFKDNGAAHRASFGTGIKNPNLELDLVPSTGNREGEGSSTSRYETTKDTSRDSFKHSFHTNRDYPYLETLRSIQANARPTSTFPTTPTTGASFSPTPTTEIPIEPLTMPLQPLVPIGLEDDAYYPLYSTSTEAYYTPSHKEKNRQRTTTQPPWNTLRFQIPDVLPDLNTLEDLVDRRKFFYIPRITSG